MANWLKYAIFSLLSLALCAGSARADVTILDTTGGIWRIYQTLKPPMIQQTDDSTKPLLFNVAWLDWETPAPPPGWAKPGFDDHTWFRAPGRRAARTPYLARLSLRGKFQVTAPARVHGLTLTLDYYGGAVVYLNGQEVGRQNLPAAGDLDKILADPYALEAFVTPSGSWLLEFPSYDVKRDLAALAVRTRTFKVNLPAKLLRNGVNVIGIDILRAPYSHIVEEKKDPRSGYVLPFNTCELRRAQVTAVSADGLVPNVTRPAGVQIWNADPLAADADTDFGDPKEPLRSIALTGPRNGTITGKIVLGSDKPIRQLHVVAADLRSTSATIPVAQISFLYGIPGGGEALDDDSREEIALRAYPQGATFLNDLATGPLKEYPIADRSNWALAPNQAKVRFGAVAPIWVRVKVPKTAAPGTYRGQISISGLGSAGELLRIPVEVKVLPWTLPDPQDFRTWVELVESPDTLAVEYKTPLWSDAHFALIARSFSLLSGTGDRIVYIPAIAHTNHGNAESMIRWIKKPGDHYDFDLSVMDKYLDTAIKYLGTPKLVCLQAWEVYMSTPESAGRRFGEILAEQQKVSGGAPLVTFLDPATGKTHNDTLPKLSDPASKAIWQALFKDVRAHLAKRGIEKTLMLGMFTDSAPSKADTQFFLDIAPDLAWVQQGHNAFKDLHGMAKVGYTATWWSANFADDTQNNRANADKKTHVMQSLLGWRNPRLDALYDRMGGLDTFPASHWYFECETAITSDIMRGIGRIGADYWKAVRDKSGLRSAFVHERFPDGEWRAVGHDISSWMLDPQPDGPVATNRLIALEDGVQECEARIFIETALTTALKARLGPDLAARCQQALDERLKYMWKALADLQMVPHAWGVTTWRYAPAVAGHAWFLNSNDGQRTDELYTLAAQVAEKIGHQ